MHKLDAIQEKRNVALYLHIIYRLLQSVGVMHKPTTEVTAIRLMSDPLFFIQHYFWIIDKMGAKIPLKLNPPQLHYYNNRTRNDLILKSRKEGFSTLIEALFLYDCLFKRYQRAVTMAQRDEEKVIHADRVKFFLKHLGAEGVPMKVDVGKSNDSEIYFPSSESYYWFGSAGSMTFGRSRDITHFHGTEVAHYQNQEVLTGALNACVPNALVALETTANGMGEAFQLLWDEADTPESAWARHFFGWWQDPTNVLDPPKDFRMTPVETDLQQRFKLTPQQLAWRRWKYSQQTDKTKFAQEYPATAEEAFISSGRHVFNVSNLKDMLAACENALWLGDVEETQKGVAWKDSEEGAVEIWEKPKRGHSYLIASDVAEGVPNGCFSVAVVMDCDALSARVVAQQRMRINPGLWGRELVRLARYYNNALLVPERNNHGHATIFSIQEEGYDVVPTKEIFGGNDDGYGFPTNQRTKELMVSALASAIEDGAYRETSRVAVIEMMRIVRKASGSIEAESGYSDCMIARAIAIFCLKFFQFSGQRSNAPLVMQQIAGSRQEEPRRIK
jgi:hypothetical protein